MRILIAADIFPPVSGGPATYVVTLANALVSLGDEVTIVSLTKNSDATVLDKRVKLWAVGFNNFLLRYLDYLELLLREVKQADCVYAMGPVNAGLPALLIAKLFAKKFVVKVVGDYAWEQGAQRFGVKEIVDEFQTRGIYPGVVGWLQRIERLVVRNATRVIVPSQYLRKQVMGWGALADNVIVIYNAISLPNVNQLQNILYKPKGEQWIVTVARLTPWKGVKEVIEVLADLRTKFPHARYKVVGDGPDLPRLQKTVEELGAHEYVEFVGNVPHDIALAYMKESDLVILNSGYEGLSHVLVEALNLECRVLVSDSGGNPEVIISGETEDLFPYNNKEVIKEKMIRALNGTMPKPFSGNIARADYFKKFQFEVMVNEARDLLQTICAH